MGQRKKKKKKNRGQYAVPVVFSHPSTTPNKDPVKY